MPGIRKELCGIANALVLLLAVSLYRQLSGHFFPRDPVRPCLVYAVYLVLLVGWGLSLSWRMTQKSIRTFLLLEDGCMLVWMTIRFVQEAFLSQDIFRLRLLGYWIHLPAVAVPLLGLYAALCFGRGDDYRFSKKWYALLVPAAALLVMAVTNETHHFLFSVFPEEPQPNLYFHPNWGMYLIYGWGLLLIAARVGVICRRNRAAKNVSRFHRLAPFLEILLLLLFCTPYTLSSFWVPRAVIEFSAGVFFIEAVSWESFVLIGLIPVNTQYETVFDRSTVAMQLLGEDGVPLVRSRRAAVLTAETFHQLRQTAAVSTPEGQELLLFPLHRGYLVWQKDVSQLKTVIAQLRQSAAELEQESVLLRQEVRLKSEEAALREQNRIYNQLTREVGAQLSLLQTLLHRQRREPDALALFRQICLVGTYVKRRCNLRLIEQSDGVISPEDLALSFRDLLGCLEELGGASQLLWQGARLSSSGFALLALDMLEALLEYEQFAPRSVQVLFSPDGTCTLTVFPRGIRAGLLPTAVCRQRETHCWQIACTALPSGYQVVLTERIPVAP